MRRLEFLINDSRVSSNNTDTNRFSVNEFVKYMNDAQERLQSLIYQHYPDGKNFSKDGNISIVANQESYDLPSDIFLDNSVYKAELNLGSNVYQPLKRLDLAERDTVFGYIILDKKILISPIQKVSITNGLRVNYAKKLPRLDVRRGTITSFSSGVSVTVSNYTGLLVTDNMDDYFSIVGRDGTIKASGLNLNSFAAGVISTDSTFSGIANGDYVVLGANSTTNSQLADSCERYLTEYCNFRFSIRDTNIDTQALSPLLQSIESELISLYKNNIGDPVYPPITNYDYFYDN